MQCPATSCDFVADEFKDMLTHVHGNHQHLVMEFK